MNTTDSNEIARRYALLQVASSRYGKSFQDLGVQEQDEVERIALKQTELQSLILSSAEARSVVIQPELISRAIESVKARYANEHEFLQALEEHDLELSSFKDIIIRETRVETVLDKISAGVEPYSETDARIFYYLHPEKFWRPETREASHILVTINPDFPENTREQAFQRLDEIAKRL
ncbi:MAG: nitrogen fixation protein NifM, partial [Pseudomonadales bacterium]|nr:nitrogen fixation protein NifM [Pseudomonadales bacterium]